MSTPPVDPSERFRLTKTSGLAVDVEGEFYDWVAALKDMAYTTERGAVPTIWSDPINRIQSIFATDLILSVTLLGVPVVDEYTITLEPGHGTVAGDQIVIADNTTEEDPQLYLGFAVLVVGDIITLDTPINHAYPVASFAARTAINLAVNGSVTRRSFLVQPPIGFNWDITRMTISMETESSAGDSRFGDIVGGLTNGIVVRLCRDYGAEYYNIANWKTNGEIGQYTGVDLTYQERSLPQGSYGVRARWTFAGPSKMGAAIRLRGGSGTPQQGPQDQLEVLVQDNIDLTSLKILFQGHWVDVVWNGA